MKMLKFDQFLLELESSTKYKEMTKVFSNDDKRSNSISVVEPKTISPKGWGELILFNEEGVALNAFKKDRLEVQDILSGFLFDNKKIVYQIPKILSSAMNILADNKTLEELDLKGSKYHILDLGQIEMWNGKFSYYPVFVPAEVERKKFKGGHFYAVAERSLFAPKLLAFFYGQNPEDMSPTYLAHQALFQLKQSKESKIDTEDFMENYSIVNPYGENFILTLDFTKTTMDSILEDAKKQINKQIASEEPSKFTKNIKDSLPIGRESSQISIRPGKQIGLIVPFISQTEFTMVTVKEILNLKDIQNSLKFRGGLGEIESIIISGIPEIEGSNKIVRSSLKKGSKIKWKSKGGGIKTGKISSDGSFITPDANLISSGTIPVRISL
jgi:hypothetical protein